MRQVSSPQPHSTPQLVTLHMKPNFWMLELLQAGGEQQTCRADEGCSELCRNCLDTPLALGIEEELIATRCLIAAGEKETRRSRPGSQRSGAEDHADPARSDPHLVVVVPKRVAPRGRGG